VAEDKVTRGEEEKATTDVNRREIHTKREGTHRWAGKRLRSKELQRGKRDFLEKINGLIKGEEKYVGKRG